ncbi:MAG: hypothetical protein M1269_07080 [Chloroflexi bacterium]|nr:hypothetical protein [Chloroflexota bacterium]
MRMLMLVYETAVDPDVVKILDELGVPGYTKMSGVTGMGKTGRRNATPVWPGSCTICYTAVPEDKVKSILERLEILKASYPVKPGLKAFALLADELI